MTRVFSILLFMSGFLFSGQVLAHAPYLEKLGYISDVDGQRYIKELRYGDGVMASDPVDFQIRNMQGAVIAVSPLADQIVVDCETLERCSVFPMSSMSFQPVGYRLDIDGVDRNKARLAEELTEREEKELNDYMRHEDVIRASGHYMKNPEFDQHRYGFVVMEDGLARAVWENVFVQIYISVPLAFVAMLLSLINWGTFRLISCNNKMLLWLLRGIGGLLFLCYLAMFFGVVIFTSLYTVLSVLGIGIVFAVCWVFNKWLLRRPPRQQNVGEEV